MNYLQMKSWCQLLTDSVIIAKGIKILSPLVQNKFLKNPEIHRLPQNTLVDHLCQFSIRAITQSMYNGCRKEINNFKIMHNTTQAVHSVCLNNYIEDLTFLCCFLLPCSSKLATNILDGEKD